MNIERLVAVVRSVSRWKNRCRPALVLLSLVGSLPSAAAAQGAAEPTHQLTLERIFASPSLSGLTARSAKISPDGTHAALLRNRPDDLTRFDLWLVDVDSGSARILVDSKRLDVGEQLSEQEKMRRERARIGGNHGLTTFEWMSDGRSLLVPIAGDIYLYGIDGSSRRLTDTPEQEADAQSSETGRWMSFTRGQNLFATDLSTGTTRKLTPDGGGTVNWGSAEFVAQEEMARNHGYWWSPDDHHIAIERYDEARVQVVTRAAIGSNGTRTFNQRYPAAGTPNVAVELWVESPDGSHRVKVDLGNDPDIYLIRVDWSRDGRTLYVQRQPRDQKTLDLLAIDPETGSSHILLSEKASTWIDITNDFCALPDGGFIWTSARSGFSHLYRWSGKRLVAITSGHWGIQGIVGIDEAAKKAFFLSNKDDDTSQMLYSVNYQHPGLPVALTPTGWLSTAAMDRNGRRAIITRSAPSQPPQTYVADSMGNRLAWANENRLDAQHPYAPYLASHKTPIFGTIKAADGSLLHTKLILPNMIPGQRHPVIVEVYNGPAVGRQVLHTWGGEGMLLDQYFAAKGWIVFSIDGRGSPARGNAFESPIYHAFGTVEVQDQLAGLAWLKAQGFVDPARVAILGWSYGGYMVLRMLEKAPGAYAAGVSGAPPTRWQLYDTYYTERYLGSPISNPEVYKRASALTYAADVRDPLLILHGMSDDNVIFDNSVEMYAALQQAGVPFETMPYPGQGHAFAPAVRLHLWRTIESFLDRMVWNRSKSDSS